LARRAEDETGVSGDVAFQIARLHAVDGGLSRASGRDGHCRAKYRAGREKSEYTGHVESPSKHDDGAGLPSPAVRRWLSQIRKPPPRLSSSPARSLQQTGAATRAVRYERVNRPRSPLGLLGSKRRR